MRRNFVDPSFSSYPRSFKFRLCEDNTITICRRPFFELKKKSSKYVAFESIKFFDDATKAKQVDSLMEASEKKSELIALSDFDGIYDYDPQVLKHVQFEFREDSGEKLFHVLQCVSSAFDPQTILFNKGEGTIFKYRQIGSSIMKWIQGSKATGIPLSKVAVGSFSICCNPHRPLVHREYLAFQWHARNLKYGGYSGIGYILVSDIYIGTRIYLYTGNIFLTA